MPSNEHDIIQVTSEMIEAGREFYPKEDECDESTITSFLTRIYQAMAKADQKYGFPKDSNVSASINWKE
jgi:hypothetical protein